MPNLLDRLLVAGFMLYSAWVVVWSWEAVAQFFWRRSVQRGFYDERAAAKRTPRSDKARQAVEELERLGFRTLGLMWEKPPAAILEPIEIALASPTRKCFATVWQSFGRPRVFFYTPFSKGAVVLTAAYRRRQFDAPVYMAAGRQGSMDAVLAFHERRVREMCERGDTPIESYAREGRLAAVDQYYRNPGVGRELRPLALQGAMYGLFAAWGFAYFFSVALGR